MKCREWRVSSLSGATFWVCRYQLRSRLLSSMYALLYGLVETRKFESRLAGAVHASNSGSKPRRVWCQNGLSADTLSLRVTSLSHVLDQPSATGRVALSANNQQPARELILTKWI